MQCTHVEDALELIRIEYAEMPDLRLTFWQAQRLWDLPDEMCQRALSELTRCGFLTRMSDGSYIRRLRPIFLSFGVRRRVARRSTERA